MEQSSQGTKYAQANTGQSGALDPRSESNLKGLHPDAEAAAGRYINQLKAQGIDARVIEGNRTRAEQSALYQIGRRGIPGEPTVTDARGGQSYHNFGVACDVAIFHSSGSYITSGAHPSYATAATVGRSVGLSPGISFGDASHFALTCGIAVSTMAARFSGGLDVYAGK
jgi:peptidoglycan L-alanyl-D-glutamate endopeptidase CwlK